MKAGFWGPLESVDLDGTRFRLLSPLIFYSAILDQHIACEAGFECDGYSSPKTPFGSFIVRGLDRRPACIHDKLYGDGSVSRDDADRVLLEAMEAVGISWWRRRLIYRGVRVGGGFFYKGTVDEIVNADSDRSGA